MEEQDRDDEDANGITATILPQRTNAVAVAAAVPLERGDRRWRIDISNESTRFRIPEGVQAFQVSVEDNVLMNKTRDILKNLEKSLMDVNGKCPFLIPKPCGSYEVDDSYCLSDGTVEQTEIGTYVKTFLEVHDQLGELVRFSQKDEVHSQVEQVLQEFVLDFLSRHTRIIGELYNNDKLNLRTLLHSVRDELLALSIVYNILSTVITADIWNYETVDCFLDRFLATTLYAEQRPPAVREVIGRLQQAILAIFERYFDGLFSTGEIDPVLKNEFIFQSVEGSMSLQTRRTRCSFWTRILIKYVESGALNARRLRTGNRDYGMPNKFSTYLRRSLRALQVKDDCSLITAQRIMRSMEYACQMCARNNAAVLFHFVMENGALSRILKQMESVYTGFAVREMAFDLFGATRISPHCSLVLSFQNSLQLSGFSPEICEKWTIRCDSGLLDDLVIKPQLSWPLCYVVDDKLLATLNVCLRFLLRLLQAQEALSAVRIDLAATKELNISRQRLNHLICFIAQPLTAISEIFFTHLQAMLTKKFALVTAAETLEEAQRILRDLNTQLTNLVTRSGSRALIHDAVTKLCERAAEVELRWRMDTVSLHDTEKMLKAVKREKDLLIGLGHSMHGTIFTLLQPLLT